MSGTSRLGSFRAGMPVAGAFAEFITVPAARVSRKPEGVTHDEAAAVALVGTTAHQALFSCAKLAAGQRVLILGGASAVGTVAIQLARLKGAWVAATSSARTFEYAASFAPDKLINYNESDWSADAELRGIDVVFDTIGEAKSFDRAKAILKPDGAFVTIAGYEAGFDPSGHPPLRYASFFCLSNEPAVQDELAELIASKQLKVSIEDRFPFTQDGVRQLFKKQDGGKSMGKNLLTF
jgi:NADPH:quinone reductase-like Zn-dependent oxidoreductase